MNSKTEFTSPAIEYLNQHKIPFKLFVHPKDIVSLDTAAKERNQSIHQVIKSILFRYSHKQFILILTNADVNIDWKKLRQVVGVRRITLAKPGEIQEILGYEIGTVSPFPPNPKIPIFINSPVLDEKVISLGSGVKNVALIMNLDDLLTALKNYSIVDI